MRHVERAGDAVDQADADQEQQRGGQVDGDVVQPRLHPRLPRSVQQQPVGRGQQHLEEDEQVEQIAGQERAVQPHQQELEQRVEMLPLPVPARPRHRPARQAPRIAVSTSIMADRRSSTSTMPTAPASRPAGKRRCRRVPAAAPRAAGAMATSSQRRPSQGSTRASPPLPIVVEQHQRAGEERDQDRRDDEVLGIMAHLAAPFPSTWSVPVKPARGEHHDEEQSRRREADDDGRQHQRLRHRVRIGVGVDEATLRHDRRRSDASAGPSRR